jgi:transposase-like protein
MREIGTSTNRRRRSRAEAERLVQDFEQSGLSRKAFCGARGIGLHTLDYYRQRHRASGAEHAEQRLVPVELVGSAGGASGLRVELSNGRAIVVEAGFDATHLKRLVAVLEG